MEKELIMTVRKYGISAEPEYTIEVTEKSVKKAIQEIKDGWMDEIHIRRK